MRFKSDFLRKKRKEKVERGRLDWSIENNIDVFSDKSKFEMNNWLKSYIVENPTFYILGLARTYVSVSGFRPFLDSSTGKNTSNFH